MGESTAQAGEECVLCMQSDRDIHRTAREGSLSQTRTGHAIVALVTATCVTVNPLSREHQASRPGLLRQRGGEVAGRRGSAVRCSIAVGTHAGALTALATN
jgi:hypothetical protein